MRVRIETGECDSPPPGEASHEAEVWMPVLSGDAGGIMPALISARLGRGATRTVDDSASCRLTIGVSGAVAACAAAHASLMMRSTAKGEGGAFLAEDFVALFGGAQSTASRRAFVGPKRSHFRA